MSLLYYVSEIVHVGESQEFSFQRKSDENFHQNFHYFFSLRVAA